MILFHYLQVTLHIFNVLKNESIGVFEKYRPA